MKRVIYEKFYKITKILRLFLNRIRFKYQIRRDGKFFKLLMPYSYRKKVVFIKYIIALVGLFSSFIIFGSLLLSFGFGLLIYILSLFIEHIAFKHSYLFIHPFPDFELDPDKWVGVGFGYARSPEGNASVPLVSMVVTDNEYAKKLETLFLKWTQGKHRDDSRNMQITVVVTKPNEYIFLCYPNLRNSVARRFFQSARDKLRKLSLKDEVSEEHLTLLFGKRCKFSKESYFLDFRNEYIPGTPVMFEFVLPHNSPVVVKEIKPFIIFDFSIKNVSELTRKDLAYDAIWSFKHGGKWQGPTPEPD